MPAVPAGEASLSPIPAIVVALILLQRFALPVGSSGLPLLLPLTLLGIVAGLARGTFRLHTGRLQLLCGAVVCCTVTAFVALVRGYEWSALSFGYLLATYIPFVFAARRRDDAAFAHVLTVFLRVMQVAAVFGLADFAAQLSGSPYHDWLGSVVPDQFLTHGFNTSTPIYFGASVYRENAAVFLEPSFFSQYLALAVLAHIHLRRHGYELWLFLAALVTTVSGTGWLLLALGLAGVALSRRSRTLIRVAVPGALVVVSLAFSPLGDVFFTRLADQTGQGSSAQDRFVAPYRTLLGAWTSDVPTIVAGQGPGAADRLADTVSGGLLAPIVAKMVLEYGIVGGGAFLLFAIAAVVRGSRSPPMTFGLAAAYFVLNAATLVPAVTVLVLVLHVWFATDSARRNDAASAQLRSA